MPPDISAGPMALAGTPGATAPGKGGEPPVSGILSATLFASLLAQSSPPAAKPFTNTGPLAAVTLKTTGTLKTMDTLPKISLPATVKAKSKASELPLRHALDPNASAHKTTPDDTAGADALNAALQTPSPAPATVPVPIPPALLALTLPASSVALSGGGFAAPQRASSAASVPQVSASTFSVSASSISASSAPAEALVPLQSAPNDGFSAAGLPLPRVGTLAAPVSAGPQTTTPVPPAVTAAAAAAPSAFLETSAPDEKISIRLSPEVPTRVLPQASKTTQSNLAHPQDAAQAAPQAAVSILRLPPVPAPAILISSNAAVSVAASVLVPSTIEGQVLPAPPVSAKLSAKSAQIALKPASENADNNTRTLPEEALQVSAKIAAPAVFLHQTTEASSEKPSVTTNLEAKKTAEPAVPLEAQALLPAAQAAKADSKPLSAADHAEMVRQVADRVGAMPLPAKPGDVQQMSLQLHPKDWGSLQVSVSVAPGQEMGGAKTVTAHIVAETPQVKAALQSQSGALHQALRASGLTLEHLTVSVKPASETKAPEVKPAGESASAGFSSGQGPSSAGSSQAQAGQPSGFAAFSGSGQHARHGQPPPAFAPSPAQAELEPEEINVVRLPMRPASGRIDTRA